MNILVTGATGFIGSHLIPALIKAGHRVTIFARKDSDISILSGSNITIKQGSFSNQEDMSGALRGIDTVIHLVGTWNTWGKSPRDIWSINVFSLQEIIRYAPKTLKQIIFLSSAHVYDLSQPAPISENSPTKPWNQYAASKLEAERILKESGRPYTILRPGIVYGQGDTKGFVANLIKTAQGKLIFIPGQGYNHIHPVHIDDLTNTIVAAAGKKANNHTVTIAGPEPVTLNDLVDNIISLSGSKTKKIHIPLPLLKLAALLFQYIPSQHEPLITNDRIYISSASRVFDTSLAHSLFGYDPEKHITETLPQVMNSTLQGTARIKNLIRTPLTAIQKATEHIETPFFIFDESTLINNYQRLSRAVSTIYPKTTIYYSAKTNYEPQVLATLKRLGACLEIACGHEIMAGTQAGFTGSQMCFDGPVKTKQDLEYAINQKVSVYNLDSYRSAEELNTLATTHRTTVNVGYRINLGMKGFLKGPAEAYITKFGIEYKDTVPLYLKTKALPNLRITSIHTHIGSQITDPRFYVRAIKQLTRLVDELKRNGITIEEINIGGGMPSPQLTKTTLLDLAASIIPFLKHITGILPKRPVPSLETYGTIIGKTFDRETKKLSLTPRLCLEPGRSLVSNMGILVSRVSYVKGNWVFLDASTYSVPESIFFAKRRFLVPEKISLKPVREYALAGSSLNTADIFSNREHLPMLNPDDLILILDAGAYSIARATQFTILTPPVYMLRNSNTLELIRNKGTYESALAQTHQGTTRIPLE